MVIGLTLAGSPYTIDAAQVSNVLNETLILAVAQPATDDDVVENIVVNLPNVDAIPGNYCKIQVYFAAIGANVELRTYNDSQIIADPGEGAPLTILALQADVNKYKTAILESASNNGASSYGTGWTVTGNISIGK